MANTQHITYQFRVKDTCARKLRQHSHACNCVWNYCVNAHKHSTKWRTKWPTAFDLIKLTTGCAESLGLHSDTVSAICRQFATSRDKHKKCPRYRGKQSLGWVPFIPRAIQFGEGAITYKKRIYRYWKSRAIIGDVKCGSFCQDARGRWYANITCEVACADKREGESVGIDLGLKTLATLSNGSTIGTPRFFRKYEDALAKAQRAGNKKRVQAIHAKIANSRKHFLHVESTRLAKSYGMIFVGNVNSGKLAKTRMAKSVLDAGWSSFRRMLSYKAIMRGGEYVEVDERYSTQACSSCGSLSSTTRPKGIAGLEIRSWVCSDCGSLHDRDVNASRNILRFGSEHRPLVEEIAPI